MVGGKNERVGGGGAVMKKKRCREMKKGRMGGEDVMKKELEVVFSAECTSVINTSTMPG